MKKDLILSKQLTTARDVCNIFNHCCGEMGCFCILNTKQGQNILKNLVKIYSK